MQGKNPSVLPVPPEVQLTQNNTIHTATWITLVGLPVWFVNTLPAHMHPVLGVRDYLAAGLFVGSFLLESIADYQKTVWRRNKNNKRHNDPFISSGLWRISRHPK